MKNLITSQSQEDLQLIVKCPNADTFKKCKEKSKEYMCSVDGCECGCLILFKFDTQDELERFKINTGTDSTLKKVEVDDNGTIKIIDKNEGNADAESWSIAEDFPSGTYTNEVIVYFIDTGANKEYWDESPFNYNEPKAPKGVSESYGYNFTNPKDITGDYDDDNGHGTFGVRHVTEHLPKGANIKIVPLKVFDKQGNATLFSLVAALHYAIDNKANIINISAGYSGKSNKILEDAIKKCNEEGIFIITSAGNEGKNLDGAEQRQFPAVYGKGRIKTITETGIAQKQAFSETTTVISVAALNEERADLHTDSNYGKESITLAGYGQKISGYNHEAKVVYSGTSVATFAVTRALAIEMAKKHEHDYKEVWEDFKASSLEDFEKGTEQKTITGKRLNGKLKKNMVIDAKKRRKNNFTIWLLLLPLFSAFKSVVYPDKHPLSKRPR